MSVSAELPEYKPAGGDVRFPETPEQEAERVGRYFIEHPVATVTDVFYGDEDRSLPDYPDGEVPIKETQPNS